MPLDVRVYTITGKPRSRMMGVSIAEGARKLGENVTVAPSDKYSRPDGDVAVFYGYEGRTPDIMAGYVAAGKRVVYVDLGYWCRTKGGRFEGYHKIAVDARHPTEYFLKIPRPSDRRAAFCVEPRNWRNNPGGHIVIAGMSGRAAQAYGYSPEQWEQEAVMALRKYTDRRIVYRPKPSFKDAKPIPRVDYSPREQPLSAALSGAWAVVTHHSNVGVDALMDGIPVFSWEGVAVPMALQDLSRIETPHRPDGREEWANAIAYCQWNRDEMRNGRMWRSLRADGLLS